MRFLLVRHGETAWNVLRLVQGSTDIELTPKGDQQALDFGNSEDLRPLLPFCPVVYSSDLKRASRTTELLVSTVEQETRILELAALRERYLGIFEGRPLTEYIDSLKEWEALPEHEKWAVSIGGGETFTDCRNRIYSQLEAISQSHLDEQSTILVVSHSDTLRSIYVDLMQRTFEDLSLAKMVGFHNLGYLLIEMGDRRETAQLIDAKGMVFI